MEGEGEWPNDAYWRALVDGERFVVDDQLYVSQVVDCGELVVPTGQLVACDPFAAMQRGGNPAISIPPGRYPVKVTLLDVSGRGDGSHIREAYASLLLSDRAEVTRRELVSRRFPDEPVPGSAADEFNGFPVDAGTACFVDDGALVYGMPLRESWYDMLFDNGEPTSWFALMDDPGHIHRGIANIPLPLAQDGANIVVIHSGWGDGIYPLVGGYDATGELVAVHIDFYVAPEPEDDDSA